MGDIDKALRVAYQENVLVFCAAGSEEVVAFPARTDSVISISSTNARGDPSPFSPRPNPRSASFATLGEQVQSSWPRNLTQRGAARSKRFSGTSVATVIAAGIAATLLGYSSRDPARFNSDQYQRLRSRQGMGALLKKLSRENGGFTYICPWTYLPREDALDLHDPSTLLFLAMKRAITEI